MKFELVKATDGIHKYVGVFQDGATIKHLPFGAVGYEDYTQHKNPQRKTQYLVRHKSTEHWDDPQTRGALARWILWDTPNLTHNIRKFKERFSLS